MKLVMKVNNPMNNNKSNINPIDNTLFCKLGIFNSNKCQVYLCLLYLVKYKVCSPEE